jgi:hypothetical protein
MYETQGRKDISKRQKAVRLFGKPVGPMAVSLKGEKVPPKAFEAAVKSAQKSFGSTIAGTCRRR